MAVEHKCLAVVVQFAPVAAAPVAAVEEDAPWEEPATPAVKSAPAAPAGESASRAQDILAMIRNRQK